MDELYELVLPGAKFLAVYLGSFVFAFLQILSCRKEAIHVLAHYKKTLFHGEALYPRNLARNHVYRWSNTKI